MFRSRNQFSGDIEELRDVESATDPYQAQARVWANTLIAHRLRVEMFHDPSRSEEQILTDAPELVRTVGGYALALENLTRPTPWDRMRGRPGIRQLSVDNSVIGPLAEAATQVGLPVNPDTFPLKLFTIIEGNVVFVRCGRSAEWEQAWPPLLEEPQTS